MYGERMEQAKEALKMILRQLPVSCRFNIVSFGCEYEFMWDPNVPGDDHHGFKQYTEDVLENALALVDEMDANMGGTEILSPLAALFAIPTRKMRHVFLFTDGGVSNTNQVLDLVTVNAASNTIHGIGIGSGCSTGTAIPHVLNDCTVEF